MNGLQLKALMPLPDKDFDTTESSVVWATLVANGFDVTFSTERGAVAECDPHLLSPGWRNPLPAAPETVATYRRMQADPAFGSPIPYEQIEPGSFDLVHLSGGHSPGMKQYLDSEALQRKVYEAFDAGKVIGAICHGVLVPARSIDPTTRRSILYGRSVTTLTKPLERWALKKTWYRVGRRYRTYRLYTEDEVGAAVGPAGKVVRGEDPFGTPLVVVDGPFVTGRYPFDVPRYAEALVKKVREAERNPQPSA